MVKIMSDTERIDWLQDTLHVVCYDSGDWFCAWRGSKDNNGFWNWTNRPSALRLRHAIDLAREDAEK